MPTSTLRFEIDTCEPWRSWRLSTAVTINSQKDEVSMEKCLLCEPNFGKLYCWEHFGIKVDILAETKSFYIMPMVGGGIDGYLLVFPKKHYPSIARLPDTEMLEYIELIKIVKNEIEDNYSKPFILEHGSLCDNISCLLDHAHTHIVPVPNDFSIFDEIDKDYPLTKLKSIKALYPSLPFSVKSDSDLSGYMFYEDTNNVSYYHLIEDPEKFVPQYLRKILLEKLGFLNWDWKENISQKHIDNAFHTLNGLQDKLTHLVN